MHYTVRGYQPGDEVLEIELDQRIVRDWVWPIGYDLDGLSKLIARPDFDPNLHLYAFQQDKMVGFTRPWGGPIKDVDGSSVAFVLFPKVLPNHQGARDLLLERAIQAQGRKGVHKLWMWGCTMWPGSFEWLQEHGFRLHPDYPRGYKIYMTYDLGQGPLDVATDWVEPVDLDRDLDEVAHLASIWYRQSPESCRARLVEMEAKWPLVAHLAVREGDALTAACILAPNYLHQSLVAAYYISAHSPRALRQLISKAVDVCREKGAATLLVDLIATHRQFEPTYLDLGFEQKAEFAVYEKEIEYREARGRAD